MRWGRRRRLVAEDYLAQLVPRRRRRNLLLTPWRWRYELAVGLGTPVGLNALADATHPVAALCIMAAAVAGYVGWPAGRRLLADRARCVLVAHRLRVGMIESGVLSWSGWLPAQLWTRAVDRGVRVLLWCPAGVDVAAFQASGSQLAAACWAADVEVDRHPRYAQLVVLLVVTRPHGRSG